MSNLPLLLLAYELLDKLNINTIYIGKDKLKIVYVNDNQKVVAFGKDQEEVIENFYYLYQELLNPA